MCEKKWGSSWVTSVMGVYTAVVVVLLTTVTVLYCASSLVALMRN